jgi:hypothetical protein
VRHTVVAVNKGEGAVPTYTTFTLKSGAIVQVESTRAAPIPPGAGPKDASSTADKAWRDGAALVAQVGGEVVQAMQKAFASVDEVNVEFGANISGKSGVILVEGTAAANLKVSVKWKKKPATGK